MKTIYRGWLIESLSNATLLHPPFGARKKHPSIEFCYDFAAGKEAVAKEWVDQFVAKYPDLLLNPFYMVRPEYRDLWSNDPEWDGIVTDDEIRRLAREWGKTVEELMEQLEEI